MITESLQNVTGFVSLLQVINSEIGGVLGVLFLLLIIAVSFSLTIKTTSPTKAMYITFFAGFVFSLWFLYLGIISKFWVGLMIIGFIGTIIYDYFAN